MQTDFVFRSVYVNLTWYPYAQGEKKWSSVLWLVGGDLPQCQQMSAYWSYSVFLPESFCILKGFYSVNSLGPSKKVSPTLPRCRKHTNRIHRWATKIWGGKKGFWATMSQQNGSSLGIDSTNLSTSTVLLPNGIPPSGVMMVWQALSNTRVPNVPVQTSSDQLSAKDVADDWHIFFIRKPFSDICTLLIPSQIKGNEWLYSSSIVIVWGLIFLNAAFHPGASSFQADCIKWPS